MYKPNNNLTINYVSGSEWDRLAEQFEDVVHEQSYVFNQARWGEHRMEFLSFKREDEVIGGAAVVVIPVQALRTGIAIVKWGPIWRKSGTEIPPSHLSDILEGLKQELAERRGLYLTIMPRGEEQTALIEQQLQSLQFQQGSQLPAPERYLVNTNQTADELRASLASKWRYNLKKAQKNDFSYRFTESESGFDTFMSLYRQMLERKQFDDHSAIYTLEQLMSSDRESFRPKIILVEYEGTVCAGAVIETSGDTAVYLYGATDDRALPLRAGYAMHWHIAEWLCANENIKWYDLGGNDRDAGLHQFKKGFIGKTGLMCDCPPNYHFSQHTRASIVGKTIFTAKDLKTNLSNVRAKVSQRLRAA